MDTYTWPFPHYTGPMTVEESFEAIEQELMDELDRTDWDETPIDASTSKDGRENPQNLEPVPINPPSEDSTDEPIVENSELKEDIQEEIESEVSPDEEDSESENTPPANEET